jgi:hypothetical protein
MRVFIDFCMTIACRIGNKGETVLHGTNYATPRLMICMVGSKYINLRCAMPCMTSTGESSLGVKSVNV